jgi:hypothetical protein
MGIMVIIVPPLDHLLVQYYGSYSLHQWLLCHDWLPNLEARLALDEEAARRVGDDRTGGPEVSRQLRLLRVIMRDLLIGVCWNNILFLLWI